MKDSKANLVALCKFTLVYIFNSTRAEIRMGARVRVRTLETVDVGVGILLPLV